MAPSPIRLRKRQLQQRNGTVERHLPLVRPIAAHYAAQTSETRDDLEQVGVLGLIRAAELYDRSQGVPFSAFARQHIRGAILHYLRDTAPLVRQPRRLQERRLQLARVQAQLEASLGRRPGSDELRRCMGLSEPQWQRLQRCEPMSARLWLDQDSLEQVPDQSDSPRGRRDDVLNALNGLQPHQREVLQEVVLKGRSLREVARCRGSSAATVHRTLHAGLGALRTRLCPPSGAAAC